jgi:hypothetical protein
MTEVCRASHHEPIQILWILLLQYESGGSINIITPGGWSWMDSDSCTRRCLVGKSQLIDQSTPFGGRMRERCGALDGRMVTPVTATSHRQMMNATVDRHPISLCFVLVHFLPIARIAHCLEAESHISHTAQIAHTAIYHSYRSLTHSLTHSLIHTHITAKPSSFPSPYLAFPRPFPSPLRRFSLKICKPLIEKETYGCLHSPRVHADCVSLSRSVLPPWAPPMWNVLPPCARPAICFRGPPREGQADRSCMCMTPLMGHIHAGLPLASRGS